MLFNSLSFAVFLPIVFILYWSIAKERLAYQNRLLLIASYFFYACWDWRFLILLIFSTLLDYFSAFKIHKSKTNKDAIFWLWLSIGINLGFLGIFKYYNFFISSFSDALTLLGLRVNYSTIQIVLPVGISFYTFHGLSYVIDIYKKKIHPEKNLINYALFVSFFPLLVAGPIERATHLLPQVKNKRAFNYLNAVNGLRQILWGLFKKIVIADNCAELANTIFNNSPSYTGSALFIGAIMFTFQIYADFSGYSDIAIGTSRLFGFELIRNFNFPYFSRDIAEFWRRWHISLSTWFRDYVYIPLGGSRGNKWQKVRNMFIIFIVSGFWHGANWTFLAWGALNAIYITPSILLNTHRNNLDIVAKDRYLPSLKELLSMMLTFGLTILAWIFFRSNTIEHALSIISKILSPTLLTSPNLPNLEKLITTLLLVGIFILIEWGGRDGQYAIESFGLKWKRPLRFAFYYSIIISIVWFGGNEQQFIYFQF
jgi:alginate O-acetyltransferase complex protein AlgI